MSKATDVRFLMEFTCAFCMSCCESRVTAAGCSRSFRFSLGAAMTVISSTSTTFKVSASSASTLPVARRQKIPAKILYLFINCFFKHLQSKGILAEGTILIY